MKNSDRTPPKPHAEKPTSAVFGLPVWGDHHTSIFLDYALPSLMSEDNLPYAAKNFDCSFVIATDEESADKMRASKVMQKLEEIMPVTYSLYDTKDVRSKWTIVRRCNQIIIDEAEKKNAVIMTLGPDSAWSSSCIKEALDTISRGYRVYVLPGYRSILEQMKPDIDANFRDKNDDSVINLDAGNLIKLGLKNMHQGMLSWFWDRPECSCLGTYLTFSIEDQGILAFCYNGHPLAIWPEVRGGQVAKIFDQDYMVESCPDLATHYIEQDATKSIFFEMSLREENQSPPTTKAFSKVMRMATRFEHFDPIVRGFYAQFPVRMPISEMDEKLWQKYEKQGLRIVNAVEFLNRLPDWAVAIVNPPQLFKRQKMRQQEQSQSKLLSIWTGILLKASSIVKKVMGR